MINIIISDDIELLRLEHSNTKEGINTYWLLDGIEAPTEDWINYDAEILVQLTPLKTKFPQLMTMLFNKYPMKEIYGDSTVADTDENGFTIFNTDGTVKTHVVSNQCLGAEMTFQYTLLTHDKEQYATKYYVCDESNIKVVG